MKDEQPPHPVTAGAPIISRLGETGPSGPSWVPTPLEGMEGQRPVEQPLESAPTAFAVLDILGYGQYMRRNPNEVFILIRELLESSAMSQPVQRDLQRFAHFSGGQAPEIEYLQFSDTLIIWLRLNPLAPTLFQTSLQLVKSLCYAVSLTLANFIATGVALRGAVGFGNTYFSYDPLFFTGCELYETMKLERKQAWAGAALHDSAGEILAGDPDKQFVVEYLVPMSECASVKPTFAVDWVTGLVCCETIIPPWERMFSSEDPRVQQKGIETKRFFETIKEQHRSFPIGIASAPIIAMKKRLEVILSALP